MASQGRAAGAVIAPARLELARDATIEVRGAGGKLLGHGLLLALPRSGIVALTCHHVVAAADDPGAIRLHAVTAEHEPVELEARLDEAASRPKNDVAVLRPVDPPDVRNPLVHVPDPRSFEGSVPAVGLIPGEETGTLNAHLVPSGRIRVPVPYPPHSYLLPETFALKEPSETQEGISGAPVVSQGGVVGLIHFARSTTPLRERAAYVNPLTAWCAGLPDLADVIDPFVSRKLRSFALVRSGRTLRPDRDGLVIEDCKPAVYLERDPDEAARRAFEVRGAICLFGRRGSGKSRLAWQLLRERPDSLVVLPGPFDPPDDLGEALGLEGREVVLLFENIHLDTELWQTVKWHQRLRRVAGRTVVMATARAEDGLVDHVRQAQAGLFETLHAEPVHLSRPDGRDLTEQEGRRLAGWLGLGEKEFLRRFDGTPGSLFGDRDRAPLPHEDDMPAGAQAGIAIKQPGERLEVPNNLPLLSSTFVGRERELDDIGGLLERARLVSLVGPEGRGKTRLAGRIAHRTLERFPGGAWWVDLVAVTDPAFVPHALGSVLGVGERTSMSRERALAERLRRDRTLVVMNGYQHVTDGVAALATRLLAAVPQLTILGTGPEPLGVADEAVYEVPSLPGPAAAGPEPAPSHAEQLFYDRAARAGVSDEDRTRVAALCRQLDNNPLAIEIAAARAHGAGVERVLDDLGGRARARGHAASGPDEAIGDAIAQTLDGLSDDEEALFAALAVFSGWWTLQSAAAVAGLDAERVPAMLRRLVDHALVLIDERDEQGRRFLLLDAVRNHALRRLEASGRAPETRARHARHYLGIARDAALHLDGAAGGAWVEQLLGDRDNLRAALTWSIGARRLDLAFPLGAALWPVWQRSSPFANGRRWLGRLLELEPDDPHTLGRPLALALADVRNGAGNLAYDGGDYDEAEQHQGRCLEIRRAVGAEELVAGSLNNLGLIARRRGDLDGAGSLFASAVDLSRRHGRAEWVARHLNNLGNVVRESGGDLDQAVTLQNESLALFSRLGSEWGAAMALCDLAWSTADGGDLRTARREFLASLVTRRRIGDRHGEGQSLNGLARIDRLEGEPQAAAERHRQAIRIFDRLGDRVRTAESLEGMGMAELDRGCPACAAELLVAAGAIRAEIGAPVPPAGSGEVGAALARVGSAAPASVALDDLLQRIGAADGTADAW